MSSVALAELVACVDRELAFRSKVYPRWVKDHKMTAGTMEQEMRRMQAVRAALIRGEALQLLVDQLGDDAEGPGLWPRVAALVEEIGARFRVGT